MEKIKYKGLLSYLGWVMVYTIIGSLISNIPHLSYIGFGIVIIGIFAAGITVRDENKEITYKNIIIDICLKTPIPKKEVYNITVIEGLGLKLKCFIWKENNNLYLIPEYNEELSRDDIKETTQIYNIGINNIDFYTTKGDIQYETKISGGGGGGTSIGGAVIGAILAKSTGAIIASRKKNKSIQSENIVHDERETYMYYKIEEEFFIIKFKYEDYETLLKIIPEKSYEYMLLNKSNKLHDM